MHSIRLAYSRHILAAHAQNFAPMTLRQFIRVVAHASYLGA